MDTNEADRLAYTEFSDRDIRFLWNLLYDRRIYLFSRQRPILQLCSMTP
jgi:hypothetical protein